MLYYKKKKHEAPIFEENFLREKFSGRYFIFFHLYASCDSYLSSTTIENAERQWREETDLSIIKTPDIRVPQHFKSFLSKGKNKDTRLFELIEEFCLKGRLRIRKKVIYFAWKIKA